jgi:hypothetical protein
VSVTNKGVEPIVGWTAVLAPGPPDEQPATTTMSPATIAKLASRRLRAMYSSIGLLL